MQITDGFRLGNITCELAYNPGFETRPLDDRERAAVLSILDQPFFYLGKGCQSYAFSSADGRYVIKFFKFQHFRKYWIDYFTFVPPVKKMRQKRCAVKQRNFEKLFTSWKTAFDTMQEEAGILFVHLNPTSDLQKKLTFTDKAGITRVIDLDKMAFMVQKKAAMLCPAIDQLMEEGNEALARELVLKTCDLLLSDYARGFYDTDPALMQNTGVVAGRPIHVDVGLFESDEKMKEPSEYKENLCQKMDQFGKWLERSYPGLYQAQQEKLKEVLAST